ALVAAALTALALTACAPVQSTQQGPVGDERTGTLRVWLFDEANRAAKERVVNDAVAEFEAAHPGVRVEVQYIQVDGRAERFRGAFSDPRSAPDVAEFGNTDLAGYVAAGGFADLTADLAAWPE